MYRYKTKGTCSTEIVIETREGKIENVQFIGGCRGNLQGLSRLVRGLPVDEVIEKLAGIPCQGATSCPDQLSRALVAMKAEGLCG